MEKLYQDSKIVQVLAAQAKNERVDSGDLQKVNEHIQKLASDPNPMNRYMIGQIMAYTVNTLQKQNSNFITMVADEKRVGYGQKAAFKSKLEGVRAFIQAKGATTPRSKVANKQVVLDTLEVSARPVINFVELKTGQANMADLINDATVQMQAKYNARIQDVLSAAAATWAAPYYGAGQGIVKATLDPMVTFWQRTGGVAILGDIEPIRGLTALTGFAANTAYSDALIDEHNNNGFIGKYIGANVVSLINPYPDESTTTPEWSVKDLFILPAAADASMRPLKVVFEGDVDAVDTTNIDDASYEVCLRQFFNAGIVVGERPYMSVYHDSSN